MAEKTEDFNPESLCSRFMDELLSDDIPAQSENNLKRCIALQRARMKEKGLELTGYYTEDSPLTLENEYNEEPQQGESSSSYKRCQYTMSIFRYRAYYRDFKRVFRKKSLDILHISTEQKEGDSPKVSHCHFLKSCFLPSRVSGIAVKTGIYLPAALSIFAFLIMCFVEYDTFPFLLLLAAVLFVGLCALYFSIFLPLYFIILSFGILLQLPLALRCGRTKGGSCYADFDSSGMLYDNLEEKAALLAKFIMLSPEGSCPYYSGPELGSVYTDYIDADYRGYIKFFSLERDGDTLNAAAEIFFVNTVSKGRKLREKKESFFMKFSGPFETARCSAELEGWTVTDFLKE